MRTSRGLTLVELLVSLVIVSIVMTAVAAVFIGVQGSYSAISRSKASIEASRSAIIYVDRTVRLAGYGLDPRFAFDFVVDGSHTKDNQQVGSFDGSDGGVAIVTDDLAFRYRDPNWIRRGGVSGTTLTLTTPFGVPFRAGQRLIVACSGAIDWAVYQLDAVVPTPTTTLTATVTSVTAPFPTSTAPCLAANSGAQAAYVMLLQERRLRIREVDGRPFLVAFRRIREADGTMTPPNTTDDFDPIAADVEEFQVAYAMNRPPDMAAGASAYRSACCAGTAALDNTGNGNWVLLDATTETGVGFLPDPTASAPLVETAYDDARRYNRHPANIRQVRLSIMSRSQRQDRSRAQYSTPQALFNYNRSPLTADGFFRLPATLTIPVPNLQSRSGFTPDLRTTAGEGNFNGG